MMDWEQFPEWQEPQKLDVQPTPFQDTETKTEAPYKIEWDNFPVAKVQGTSET